MSQTYSKKRATEVFHPTADRGLLGSKPGINVLLPDVHRAAHHDQQIEIVQAGNDLVLIQFDGAPFIAVFAPELTKKTRVFYRNVLEDQNPHRMSRAQVCWRHASMKQAPAVRNRGFRAANKASLGRKLGSQFLAPDSIEPINFPLRDERRMEVASRCLR